jgi:hypothetical protein
LVGEHVVRGSVDANRNSSEYVRAYHLSKLTFDTMSVEESIARRETFGQDTFISAHANFINAEPGDRNSVGSVKLAFPPPSGLYCNMMPFAPRFPNKTIPSLFTGYMPFIKRMLHDCSRAGAFGRKPDESAVWYLSIHESTVQTGKSQRRGGLHVETPGRLRLPGTAHFQVYAYESWGSGYWRSGSPVGGILQVSNVNDTCAVWLCTVDDPADVVGPNGNIEHMRSIIETKAKKVLLKANQVCW